MSQQYDNTNRGILSRNDRKEEDSHPDFTGQINVAGVDYWLNGWTKERKDGSGRFFSLSVKPKQPQSAPQSRAPAPAAKPAQSGGGHGFEGMDDDVPFADPFKSRAACLAC